MQGKSEKPLWQWAALSQALVGSATSGPDVGAVVVDSRLVQAGDLFVALPGDPGEKFNPSYRSAVDGHDYVGAAKAKGAAGAVVHKPVAVEGDFPLIAVADTYDALWDLGTAARQRIQAPTVGVTGSSGKTTAKRFLQAALGAYAPPGSFNNHIGVPLSLANTPSDCAAAVYEIGTNHPGEILPLAKMVTPDVAVVLNVHTAHIVNFSTRQDLFEEKVSIFKVLEDKSNSAHEDLLQLDFGHSFGYTDSADARVVEVSGDKAQIDLFGRRVLVRVPGGGNHRASTVAATLLVTHMLGMDLASACDLPNDLIPVGRGNQTLAGRVTVVDESYNANPQSMAAAITSFASMVTEYRVAVIGEMLELGEHAEQAHLSLAEELSKLDKVYCVGPGSKALAQLIGAHWVEAADGDLVEEVQTHLRALQGKSVVMVKGSNRVFWANDFVERLTRELA